MFKRIFGFKSITRKVEEKLIQLSFIPSKYFEALYVECNTKIPCHTLDILEVEEKNVRGDLLKLMKEGEVDTKIEIEKFQLFERINAVSTFSKEIRLTMNKHVNDMNKITYNNLVKILKETSKAGKLLHESVRQLYTNYDSAIEKVKEMNLVCNKVIDNLFSFKFCDEEGICEYSFEEPEVFIGNALQNTLREMIGVGEKIVHLIKIFSYNHKYLKDPELLVDKEEKSEFKDEIQKQLDEDIKETKNK